MSNNAPKRANLTETEVTNTQVYMYRGQLPNRWYNALKWIALIFLPASAVLYAALAQTWGWPHESEIRLTITAVDLFLGTLLGVSTVQYNKNETNVDGDIFVDMTEESSDNTGMVMLALNGHPKDLAGKRKARFNVISK